MAESIGVPLREYDYSFLARASFAIERWKPTRVHGVVLRIRRSHWRRESQELCRFQLAGSRHLFQLFKLLLLAHVGGKELGQTLLQPEVSRRMIAEKAIAIADNFVI